MPKPPQKRELSSDEIWDLIKPRIEEYLKVGKVFLYITAGVVSALFAGFSFFVGALLKSEDFRNTLVTSIVSLDKLLTSNKDKTVFYDQINEYFKTKNLVTVFDDPSINIPLKARAKGYLDDSFAATLQKLVINNSFSTSFQLSDARRTYNMRFLKPEGGTTNIECGALYSSPAAKRNVYTFLNDDIAQYPVATYPEDRARSGAYQGGVKISLTEPNKKYFTKIAPDQDTSNMAISFSIDDDKAFEGIITLDCMVTVTGSARLALAKGG